MFHKFLLVSGSNPVVGSSKKIIFGYDTRLIAMDSLLFIPRGSSVINYYLYCRSWTSFNAFVTFISNSYGGIPFILAKKYKCSSTVSSFHNKSNWGQTPICNYTISSCDLISKPPIHALPSVGGYRPESCVTRVVFPAPLGPNNPNSSPYLTLKLILLLATFGGLPFTPG